MLRAFCPNICTVKKGDYGGINRFSYSYLPALRGLPDLPTWLKYKYSQRHSSGKLTIYIILLEKSEMYLSMCHFKLFPQDLFTEFHQGPMKFINCLLWLQIEKLLKLDF